MRELEEEFFRVEGGENPDGIRARVYVNELKRAPNGDRIVPLERAALEYLAQWSFEGVTRFSVQALGIYLDVEYPRTKEVLMGLVFKGVLRPQMLLEEWRMRIDHAYSFAELEKSA